MDHTAHNIYMGLAGLYLIEDEHEAGLELPQDEYDVPLILQDRSFRKDGSLAYDGGAGDRIGAQGNVILVNGIPWPKFEVSARKYRFRILNGSNATVFRLALNNGQPFGTDRDGQWTPSQTRGVPGHTPSHGGEKRSHKPLFEVCSRNSRHSS
jgi:spore coat protein A